MPLKNCTEVIFEANLKGLTKAHNYLEEKGIPSLHNHPKEGDGVLKVAPQHADESRELLKNLERGKVI